MCAGTMPGLRETATNKRDLGSELMELTVLWDIHVFILNYAVSIYMIREF